MNCQEIRDSFLGYFEERGHLILPSAPLVTDDPTTLFTVAGMQPFVGAFRGEERPPAPRVATNQKCARMGDLERVGRSATHHTFFEMLGNFSFGDYFKEGAIEYAWEYVVDVLGIPRDDLWITVFEDDDQAEEIWHKRIGVPMNRIVRLGRCENWWPEERWAGPCGPCTEIHMDNGPGVGCGRPDCGPACDCNRFVELWNLVFQMYTEAVDGTLTELPKPGVDTGMGFERLAMIMQKKAFSAETDEMWRIIERTIEIAREDWGREIRYGVDPDTDVALRVICDHARGAAMLTADGVAPTNEGAGYVLRRFLRRAYRFGLEIGADGPFMHKVLPTVADVMGTAYPELHTRQEFSVGVVKAEEEQFATTLAQGMERIAGLIDMLKQKGSTEIPGDEAFRLYDTFGLPREMTVEIAGDHGMTVDMDGFEAAMEQQRQRSRAAVTGLRIHDRGVGTDSILVTLGARPTDFVGYDVPTDRSDVYAILRLTESMDFEGDRVEELTEGSEGILLLDRTPFYAERGGQIGDAGVITGDGFHFEVTDTQPLGEAVAHIGRVTQGSVAVGATVTATVDEDRRDAIRRHHTATHLLHAALRQEIGGHVKQAGSLVGPERLRFDFSHHQAVDHDTLVRIEERVNRWILEDLPVDVEVMDLDEAQGSGAIALFGEKYGETVRTVRVGESSFELCGGIHACRTGEIGSLRVLSEGSVAAGTRRIEAVAGMAAVRHSREADERLAALSRELNCPVDEMAERIEAQRGRIRELEREVEQARQMSASVNVPELAADAIDVAGVKLVASVVADADREMLKSLADEVVEKLGSGVAVFGGAAEGKVALVAKVSDDLLGRGAHAGNLVKGMAEAAGGGGGGGPKFAQAGGGDPSKLDEAIAVAAGILGEQLEG
ncbi:MAG: alanine--tRNA ligase [candidate division WS1 bacterium]|jgi:alanyl-tRNA synthetase|nr:alanine--tRNA ligase [candidate division WS1 bacterium]